MVLDAVQLLNREIKGRTESLNPLFVIGGVYPVKNPFFLGKLKAKNNTDRTGYKICVEPLTSILAFEYSLNGSFHKVVERTNIGFIEGYWTNENELRVLIPNQKDTSLNAFFDYLKAGVKSYYGVA